MHSLATVLAVATIFLCGPATFASTPPVNLKTECVGRMQINLPGEVDVAAETEQSWAQSEERVLRFPDEQRASWSSNSFLGQLKISHPKTSSELEQSVRYYADSRNKFKPGGEVQKITGEKPFSELPTAPHQGVAWQLGEDHYAILLIGSNVVGWRESGGKEIKVDYQTLLTGLRPRPLFDVPREPGVCLPYLFVRDDGQMPRHIGMTYRLKAHPDITVWLEDASAARLGERQNPEKLTARYKAAFFWNQRYQNYRSIESQWPLRRTFKDTLLAGLPGVKTFVKLTRDDKERTEDYGYLAAVRGNPDASEDHPDLMLYVIQDSINATKRGIAPLTKQEFIDIAEKIAASVRRREVKNSRKHDSQQSLSSDV
jgi:hypothetical protein